MNLQSLNKNLVSTKFIMAVLVLISISIAFFIGRLTEKEYVNGITMAFFIYSGANLWEKRKIKNNVVKSDSE